MNINKNIKAIVKLTAASAVVAILFSTTGCQHDPLSPGYEYAPDMYRGPALEPYSETKKGDDMVPTSMTPAPNTIAVGYEPYAYANTPEGYAAAGTELKNPLADIKKAEADGKVLFTKYCVHCHGEKGDGAGTIKVGGDAFPVPSYFDEGHKNVSDGSFYHTLMFGKGLMGSHASQVNREERWKLIAYVNKLQRDGLGITEEVAPAIPSAKTAIKK